MRKLVSPNAAVPQDSSPAQRGRGTMRSMVEGAQPRRECVSATHFITARGPLHRLPRFAGEENRGIPACA